MSFPSYNSGPNYHLIPDYDLQLLAHNYLERLKQHGVCIQFVHVKSHQDKDRELDTLSFKAQLNVLCDKRINQFMMCPSEGQEPLSVPLIPPHVPALITHKGRPLQGSLGRMLLLHTTGPPLQEYLCAKYKWTSSTFISINWMAHGTAFQCYP